jgi:polysaccharide deacetylase family protein (PEP-CTERM system associated)
MSGKIVNFLTVDVEDYFQVEGFGRNLSEADWDSYEIRFPRGLEWLLQILDSARIKATFFILGWIAERYPFWVKEIVRKGHEVAVHGFYHRRVDRQEPQDFKAEISRTKALLSDLAGMEILGHRAPSFSITPQTPWAWDILLDCGLTYDASLSVNHFVLGKSPWKRLDLRPQDIQTATGQTLMEFPQAFLPRKPHLPFAGGGYFRLYPYWLTRRGIAAWNRRGVPVMVYVHPWEFDPDQPRLNGGDRIRRFKHYVNLDINREKFARLLQDFSFGPCRDYLAP